MADDTSKSNDPTSQFGQLGANAFGGSFGQSPQDMLNMAYLMSLFNKALSTPGNLQPGETPQAPLATNQAYIGGGANLGYPPVGGNVHFMGGLPFKPPTTPQYINAISGGLQNILQNAGLTPRNTLLEQLMRAARQQPNQQTAGQAAAQQQAQAQQAATAQLNAPPTQAPSAPAASAAPGPAPAPLLAPPASMQGVYNPPTQVNTLDQELAALYGGR